MQKYVFKKYKPIYKKYFLKEKLKLYEILGNNIKIEHVGSTAVPGLGGKGIIDILIGTNEKGMARNKIILEKNDYEFRVTASFPGRYFFRKDYQVNKFKRRIHIHLVVYKKNDWQRMIKFRNFLINNPKAVKEYEKIKKNGVVRAKGNGEIYRAYKQDYIEKNYL